MNDVCKGRFPPDFHTHCEPLSLSLWVGFAMCSWGVEGECWFLGPLQHCVSWSLPGAEQCLVRPPLTALKCLTQIRRGPHVLSPPIKSCPCQAHSFNVLHYLRQINISLPLKWIWGMYVTYMWVCGFGQPPFYYTHANCLPILLSLYFIN